MLNRASTVSIDDTGYLLQAVIDIGDSTTVMTERRQQLLSTLLQLLNADLGYWAWGRGRILTKSITPLAFIDIGFSNEQKGILAKCVLKKATLNDLRTRIDRSIKGQLQVTVSRHELFSPDEWKLSGLSSCAAQLGMDSWVICSRYHREDSWSSLGFFRKIGRDEFGSRHAAIIDFAAKNIRWFHVMAEEKLVSSVFVDLTDRQRVVMIMLLDGMTRKQISNRLKISENTVSDHIKAIYRHFGVGTANKLSAVILRGQ